MSPAARARALSALQRSLRTRWHEIYVQLPSTPPPLLGTLLQPQGLHGSTARGSRNDVGDGGGGEVAAEIIGAGGSARGVGAEVRSDVVRCAWRLAALAAELSPEEGGQSTEGKC
jgi:hypothetical protein